MSGRHCCLHSFVLTIPSIESSLQYQINTMKLAVLSTAAASAAAFAPAAQQSARSSTSTSALHMAEPEKSQALPFAPRPKLLDGTLPGDVGFDPFGFAGDDKASLMNQREAEIKHGELLLGQ